MGCCFTGKLGEWWSSIIESGRSDPSLVPNDIEDLIDMIQASYSVKDFQAEHLIKLLELRQQGNSPRQIQDYGQNFLRFISTWKSHMGWKLQAYLYIRGLNDVNIRSELMHLVKKGDFDDVPEKARLQRLIARSATCVLNRSDPTSGAKRPNPDGASTSGHASGNASGHHASGAASGAAKNGGGGGNGKGNANSFGNSNKKQKQKRSDKNAIMQSEVYKAEAKALKEAMTPAEFQDHCDNKKCLKCHKKGHMLWQCFQRNK